MKCPRCQNRMRLMEQSCDEHGMHLWWICLCGASVPFVGEDNDNTEGA